MYKRQTFSYGLENIYRYAFEYCTALKSVYLPTSLTTLSEAAFDHTGITSLIIPYGVTDCFGVNSDSIQEISVPSTADFSASTKMCIRDRVNEATQTADDQKRLELYGQAEELLIREAAIAPVYFQASRRFYYSYVNGLNGNTFDTTSFKGVYTSGR